MASITKEVTSGKATYGPWHQFYQRQLAVAKEVAGLENSGVLSADMLAHCRAEQATQTEYPLAAGDDMDGYQSRPNSYNNNNFYQRLLSAGSERDKTHLVGQSLSAHRFPDPGPPTCRAGRLGAPWRHVRQCTGNNGNHICFIDGTVKQDDMDHFPPYGYVSPEPFSSATGRQMAAPVSKSFPTTKFSSSFNNHARSGFKYWYEEKKAVPGGPKQTIGGRLMKMGVGY